MIPHTLLKDQRILIITPQDPLEAIDFESLAKEIDPFIEEGGELNGLLIDAESFPGWKDFNSFLSHFRFVREHHRKIKRVAAVSDDQFLWILPSLAKHFVEAEVRHFAHEDREQGMNWLLKGDCE